MKKIAGAVLFAAFALPVSTSAQLKTSTSVAIPTASDSKIVALADFVNVAGTTLTSSPSYLGSSCGNNGCIIAKAAAGATPVMSIHLGGEKVQAAEVRTGLLISHDVAHSLDVSLNGMDIISLLCNGLGSIKVMAKFAGMGATVSGFSWQLLDGSKILNSGHGSGGEGIAIDMGHAGPMQLAISNKGVISIEHGTQRLILTSDAKDAIGAKTGGYLRFEDLGLRVAGTSEFGVLNTALKTGVQSPSQ